MNWIWKPWMSGRQCLKAGVPSVSRFYTKITQNSFWNGKQMSVFFCVPLEIFAFIGPSAHQGNVMYVWGINLSFKSNSESLWLWQTLAHLTLKVSCECTSKQLSYSVLFTWQKTPLQTCLCWNSVLHFNDRRLRDTLSSLTQRTVLVNSAGAVLVGF